MLCQSVFIKPDHDFGDDLSPSKIFSASSHKLSAFCFSRSCDNNYTNCQHTCLSNSGSWLKDGNAGKNRALNITE